MRATRTRSTVKGLALACHPGPTVVVTLAVTLLAAAGGRDAAGCVLVAAAVLTGQLSIGWSNDAIDARRDLEVQRADKPVVAGLVSVRVLAVAAGIALAATVVLSFAAAGPAGGTCQLVLVASAWAYNLGLKSTRFSLVPYAIGFGALPGFVSYGLDPSVRPQAWATVAAGLLGVAAGLANAAPDIDDDGATGVHGAVHRLGARASRTWCALVVVAATVVLAFGADLVTVAAGALVAVAVVVAASALRMRGGRLLFPAVLVLALIDVVVASTLT